MDEYGKFVEEGVRHYTRSGPNLRVNTFSFWNEPNSRAWLKEADASKEVLARLYRSLYLAAYTGYINATKRVVDGNGVEIEPAVTGTQVFLGELSSGKTVGRSPDGELCVDKSRGQPSCQYSPVDFLRATVKSTAGTSFSTFPADGVSLHPYQDRLRPDQTPKGNAVDIGISRLGEMNTALAELYKQGKIRSSAGKQPGLYLTEFGYRSIPSSNRMAPTPAAVVKKNAYWHTEATRATWFGGSALKQSGKISKGAFDRALAAHAKWMLLWEVVEWDPGSKVEPPVRRDMTFYGPDYGIVSSPALTAPPDDIKGTRPYGKQSENGTKSASPYIYRYEQKRTAYCAIRQWVIDKGYFSNPPAASRFNACPRPASARGGS